jgi:MFS family permease
MAFVLCFVAIVACGFAAPLTFTRSIYVVVILLWIVLFCGGAVMPACSGIIVSIVPRNHRHISSSVAMVVFNMFGYFMSLVLSGVLMQVRCDPVYSLRIVITFMFGFVQQVFAQYKDTCDDVCALTWGFRLILMWSYWGLLFLLLSLAASYRIAESRINAKRLAWQHRDE